MYFNNNILTLPKNIEQLIYCVIKKMEEKKKKKNSVDYIT